MASIYKPSRTDRITGKRVKCRHYRIAFLDEHGNRRSVKGYKDKSATEAKAREIERNIERKKAGLPVIDSQAQPFNSAVGAYLNELIRRGSKSESSHVKENRRQLITIMRECGWDWLRQVNAARFAAWLSSREGMAPRTQNHYHSRFKAFLAFCVERNWIESNPLAQLKLAKVGQKGRRRLRRAFTRAEWDRLLAAAPDSRRLIYLVASLSGLRRKELRLLEKQDCTPTGDRPRWHLRPDITKNGQGSDLPMLPECAETLGPLWEKITPASGRLFKSIPAHTTLHADLRRAGITRQDERGRWADFHSFRYTFCTFMGTILPIQKVKVLMRHSTIKLTADLYTDLGIDDVAEGIWSLPRLQGVVSDQNNQGQEKPGNEESGGRLADRPEEQAGGGRDGRSQETGRKRNVALQRAHTRAFRRGKGAKHNPP